MERFERFRVFGSGGSSWERGVFCAFRYSLRGCTVLVPVSVPEDVSDVSGSGFGSWKNGSDGSPSESFRAIFTSKGYSDFSGSLK